MFLGYTGLWHAPAALKCQSNTAMGDEEWKIMHNSYNIIISHVSVQEKWGEFVLQWWQSDTFLWFDSTTKVFTHEQQIFLRN